MAWNPDYDKLTDEQRALLSKGLPTAPPIAPLPSGEFTGWKQANQGPVLALTPDGPGLIAAAWVAELEKHRIGQEMAAERAAKTRENLNDLAGGLTYEAAYAWGFDPDKASDV